MVIEFNARFGDPEAMNVLPLLETDLVDIMERIVEGGLGNLAIRFCNKATVCKYIVPEGYPESPLVENPYAIGPYEPALLYYANVEERNGSLFTRSSRTLAFVGLGETLSEAERIAETAASNVEGRVRHRRDIGTKELLDRRIAHMRELR